MEVKHLAELLCHEWRSRTSLRSGHTGNQVSFRKWAFRLDGWQLATSGFLNQLSDKQAGHL